MSKIVIWNGNNLKEVLSIVGRHESLFNLSYIEYERYVKEKGLKLIYEDIRINVPIGTEFILDVAQNVTINPKLSSNE